MGFWKRPEESAGASGAQKAQTAGAPASTRTPASVVEPANGHGNGAGADLDAEQLSRMATASKVVTGTFGEIVALLMHSPQYKYYTLADMEWLVLPALVTGQFSLATAQSRTNGITSPVGVVLWASVSDEVDQRLSVAGEQALRLKPQEWKSGDIPWIVLAVGNQRVLQGIFKGLQEKQWGKRPAKALGRGKDGKPTIVAIEPKAA